MRRLAGPAALLSLLLYGCAAAPVEHVASDPRWLFPDGRLSTHVRPFPEGRPLRVAVFGDAQGNLEAQRQVLAAIRTQKPDLVVFVGDAAHDLPAGFLPDWGAAACAVPFWPQRWRGERYFGILSLVPFPALWHHTALRVVAPPHDPDGFNMFLESSRALRVDDAVPMLFVPGNHDLYHHGQRADLARLLGAPSPDRLWSFVDIGGFRFVTLDGGSDLAGEADPLREDGEQWKWLEATLKEADGLNLWSIVSVHEPPYSSAAVEPPKVSSTLIAEKLLASHKVALVLSGHAHWYERVVRRLGEREVTCLTTGGAGGPFTRKSEDRVEPGSQATTAGLYHYVMLEMSADSIRGKMIPLEPKEHLVVNWQESGDEFEVKLK